MILKAVLWGTQMDFHWVGRWEYYWDKVVVGKRGFRWV